MKTIGIPERTANLDEKGLLSCLIFDPKKPGLIEMKNLDSRNCFLFVSQFTEREVEDM